MGSSSSQPVDTVGPGSAPKPITRTHAGRSLVSRPAGVVVHITAGFGDVGCRGDWTLECLPARPVRVYPGVPLSHFYHSVKGDISEFTATNTRTTMNIQPSLLFKESRQHRDPRCGWRSGKRSCAVARTA